MCITHSQEQAIIHQLAAIGVLDFINNEARDLSDEDGMVLVSFDERDIAIKLFKEIKINCNDSKCIKNQNDDLRNK